jgi:hypothetical protein
LLFILLTTDAIVLERRLHFLFGINLRVIMRAWALFALSAAGGIALASADLIESSDFNVIEGLQQLCVDVPSIPVLQSFSGIQARSTTEGACPVAAS